ncbi:hypothetical protein BDV36DRAFT_301049 [Aspergillus pseudocaelatus]|uniref:DNA2/NAM7 helicase-like C-terminal domain-containing protein n=1 Tax=Aspergillus pseudocaelatus TaxID=1825620 RepID=A0ABQ6W572_9EURO|nr:hypothetical protein BDV36DRAFT_301049 [Aspergillus pseudocaelatus]
MGRNIPGNGDEATHPRGDIVIVMLTKSSAYPDFLTSPGRINVMTSRAKHCAYSIGNWDWVSAQVIRETRSSTPASDDADRRLNHQSLLQSRVPSCDNYRSIQIRSDYIIMGQF